MESNCWDGSSSNAAEVDPYEAPRSRLHGAVLCSAVMLMESRARIHIAAMLSHYSRHINYLYVIETKVQYVFNYACCSVCYHHIMQGNTVFLFGVHYITKLCLRVK